MNEFLKRINNLVPILETENQKFYELKRLTPGLVNSSSILVGDSVVVRRLICCLRLLKVSHGGNFCIYFSYKQVPTQGFSLTSENEINAYSFPSCNTVFL